MYGSKALFILVQRQRAVNISDYTASVNRVVSAINRKEGRRGTFVLWYRYKSAVLGETKGRLWKSLERTGDILADVRTEDVPIKRTYVHHTIW